MVDYDEKSYENNLQLAGSSTASMVVQCAWADRFACRNQFLGDPDPNDGSLYCSSGLIRRAYEHDNNPIAVINLSFVPVQEVEENIPDNPFKIRYEWSTETFSIKTPKDGGGGANEWVWASGEPIKNEATLPTKQRTLVDVVLYGVLSSMDLSTFSAYLDKCNDGVFLGAATGHVLFRTASAQSKTIYSATHSEGYITVYDAEVRLTYSSIDWREFFNEDTGAFEKIKMKTAGDYVYTLTSFAGLLT